MNSILKKIVDHKIVEIENAKLRRPIAELIAQSADQPPPLDFVTPLRRPGVQLIAEVKKASPSAGVIRVDFDPVAIATTYADAGAACISVLTDEHFFQGSLDFLIQIRSQVDIPLLRKDFILDNYQVYEARAAGADAILLIAECLAPEDLIELHQTAVGLGMTPLVELYEEANLTNVLACSPALVGVNNRNLNTFETDLQHSIRLRNQVPKEIAFVSESGIHTREHVELLENSGVDAMLVGESLMKSDNIADAVRILIRSR